MSKPQRFWLGLLYGAVFVLGAAYAFFQHRDAINWPTVNWPTVPMKETFPYLLLLVLALLVYGLFRMASSVRELLNGASLAALGTLQTNLLGQSMSTAQRVSRGSHRLGIVLAGAFFSVGMLGSQALADNFPFVGNQLYDWCRMADTAQDENVKIVSQRLCAGYIGGVADTLSIAKSGCLEKGTSSK